MTTDLAEREVSAVQEAFDTATFPKETAEEVQKELEALKAFHSTLLPIEQHTATSVEERIKQIRKEILHAEMEYPKLSLDVLSWRWKNHLPKLVLIPVAASDPSFNIYAEMTTGGVKYSSAYTPEFNLANELAKRYSDVTKLAETYCFRRGSKRTYTFTFKGVIPMRTRMKIAEVLKAGQFAPSCVYLLVEAPEKAWEVTHKKGMSHRERVAEAIKAIQLDPLVVGFKHDALWVIDKFDLTTLEQYVADEFGAKALLPG